MSLHAVIVARRWANFTEPVVVPKFFPEMVIGVPTWAELGEMEVILAVFVAAKRSAGASSRVAVRAQKIIKESKLF